MNMPRLAPIAVITLALPGCAGDAPLPGEQVLAELVPVLCEKIVACAPDEVPDESECRQAMAASFGPAMADPDFSAALELTRPALNACLAALDAMQCDRLAGTPPDACGFIRRRTQ